MRRHTLSSTTTSACRDGWVTVDQRGLVELARRGDHDAFAVLARDAVARLDAAARLILRDAELARDAVQEAFIQAWRDLPGLRDPDRFDAWLHRLTVHSCIDAARRRRRRIVEVELTPFDGPVVGDIAALVADRDLLDRALARLEPERACTRRPALLPRAERARRGRCPGHPPRHRQVTSPSVARADARDRSNRNTHATSYEDGPQGRPGRSA